MKHFIYFIPIMLITNNLAGQMSGQVATYTTNADGGYSDALYNYAVGSLADKRKKTVIKEESIQGSAYTSPTFLPGKLFYDNDFQGDILYRYNAYMEEIEMKNINLPGAEVLALSRDKKLKIINTSGNEIAFKTYIDEKGLTQNGYLSKLNSGKYTLYERVDVKFTEGQKAQNSFVPAIPPRFSLFTQYYLEIEGKNRLDEISFSNKKLLKLVPPEKVDYVKEYLKRENIRIKSVESLLRVLNFLNN